MATHAGALATSDAETEYYTAGRIRVMPARLAPHACTLIARDNQRACLASSLIAVKAGAGAIDKRKMMSLKQLACGPGGHPGSL